MPWSPDVGIPGGEANRSRSDATLPGGFCDKSQTLTPVTQTTCLLRSLSMGGLYNYPHYGRRVFGTTMGAGFPTATLDNAHRALPGAVGLVAYKF